MFKSVTKLLHNPIVCFPERRKVILRHHILFPCGPFWCVSPSSSECLPPLHVWFIQYLCVSFLSHKTYTLAHLTSLGLSELFCEKSQKSTTHCQGMSQPGKQSEEWRKAPVLHVTPLVPLQVVISQDIKAALYEIGFLQTLSFHICIVEEMAVNFKDFRSKFLLFYENIMFQNINDST